MEGHDSSQKGRSSGSSKRTSMEKLSWTPELDLNFLKAIVFLGHNKEDVVPNNILKVMMSDESTKNVLKKMNVQTLTREHVASHLQKLRRFLYSKPIRMNKFGIKNRDCTDIKMMYKYIKDFQLVAEPNSSGGRRGGASSNGRHLGVPLSTTEQDESSMVCQLPNNPLHWDNNASCRYTKTQVFLSHNHSDCFCSIPKTHNNNNNVSVPSFGDNNVVAAGNNYHQTMASFGENNAVAAQNNDVGLGQRCCLTTDGIFNNSNQKQGFEENCLLPESILADEYSNLALPDDGISQLELSDLDNFNEVFEDWKDENWLCSQHL